MPFLFSIFSNLSIKHFIYILISFLFIVSNLFSYNKGYESKQNEELKNSLMLSNKLIEDAKENNKKIEDIFNKFDKENVKIEYKTKEVLKYIEVEKPFDMDKCKLNKEGLRKLNEEIFN